jgi:hypothetical protein
MSNNYTYSTTALKTEKHDTSSLRIKEAADSDFVNILDIIPNTKDGNKNIEYGRVPKIEFLGKFVSTTPVYDSNNKLTSLQVYIQENRNYPELNESITTDQASIKAYYLFNNQAAKPSTLSAWGESYDKCDDTVILKASNSSWGTVSISAGASGDSELHGTTKGFSIPNLTSKIKVTVYSNNSSTGITSETPIIATSGSLSGNGDTNKITISGTSKLLDSSVASSGRSPNTIEITNFNITIKPDAILSKSTGGTIAYKIELINNNNPSLIYERSNDKALFFGVYTNSSASFKTSNLLPATRVVSGVTYNCEGSKVTVDTTNGTGFTGGARSTLNVWKFEPNKGNAVTVAYKDTSHTSKNTSNDIISKSSQITFTGNDFNGNYSITTKIYGGVGTESLVTPDGFDVVFDNVWANPSVRSSTLSENFADSDSGDKKTRRLTSSLQTNWVWGAGEAACKPWSNGKGKLVRNGVSSNVQHVRHLYIDNANHEFYNSYRSNFNITFDSSSTWSDWNAVKVFCALKNEPTKWYAVNQKANTFTSDKIQGLCVSDITDSLTSFDCQLPGKNTLGKDGLYIKIVIPANSAATVYPYTVTFK